MTTRTTVIAVFVLFLLSMLSVVSAVGVVFAHGDEEHDNLPSEVSICHAISADEREACYLALCEGAVAEECMEDIIDAAMIGSGPQFAKAVLADLVSVKTFDADAYMLAKRMGRILGEQLVRGEGNQFGSCGSDFGYGCVYGFFEAFASATDGGESDDVLARQICTTIEGADVAGQEMCYHKMGHVFMKRNSHTLAPALAACDALLPEVQSHCWDGVFMENMNEYLASSEGGGFVSDDVLAPCSAVAEEYREQCYKNHGRYLMRQFDDDTTYPVADECVGAGVYEETCRQSVHNALSGVGHHHHTVEIAKDEQHDTTRSWWQKVFDGITSFFAGLFGGAEEGDEQHHDESDHAHEGVSMGDGAVSFVFPRGGVIPDAVGLDAEIITYREGQFQPNTVSIQPGQIVTWVNEDQVFWPAANLHPTHKQYPGSSIIKCNTDERAMIFDACEAMGPGAIYAFRFNEVGEWKYHDHINPQATGTVIVSE